MNSTSKTTRAAGLALRLILLSSALLRIGGEARAADWPCYKADASRSSLSGERLALPLVKAWIYEPAQPPHPAWPEPGKELHRLDFDYAFQPVIAAGVVYFGSSADDSIHALDAATGKLKWRFTTLGPVRTAPHVADGRCYAASDDGFVYCLDAATGGLVWKFRAAPGERKMLGNGRMISRWPCRSGVLVLDGVVYTTAGMWPAEGIYVYALDAETGEVLWCNDSSGDMYREQPHGTATAFTGVCPQGYMLASDDLLLVPSGRTTPGAYDRQTGELVYYQPYLYLEPYGDENWGNRGNGGSWATIAGDVFFNPAHSGGAPDIDIHVGESPARPGDGMAMFDLAGGLREMNLPDMHRVIVADGVLYGVGGGNVRAVDMAGLRADKTPAGHIKWTVPHARAYSVALVGDALLVGGHDTITAFNAESGRRLWSAEVDGRARGIAAGDGSLVVATGKGTVFCFAERMISVDPAPIRERLTWDMGDINRHLALAAELVETTGVRAGYAAVVGQPDSRLAVAIASRSDLHVISVVDDRDRAEAERERVLTTGLYGSRVVVEELDDLERLPYADYFADLVVASGDGASGRELYRILRPCGGAMCLVGMDREAAEALLADADVPDEELKAGAPWPMVVRGSLPGAGEWRYQWADAGNSGIGQDTRARLPLELLWFGGPGPDRMMSRHWGTTTPLSVNGRVFLTGQHHIICFDAYNGRELWATDLRDAGRKTTMWVSGNFVADDDSLYVATGSSCYRLDQRTGKTRAIYTVPEKLRLAPAVDGPGVDVQWPEVWRVVGPLPKQGAPLSEGTLAKVPAQVTVNGKTFEAKPLRAVGGVLDFTYLYGGFGHAPLKPGQEPGPYPRGTYSYDRAAEGQRAYAFATINCARAGRLTIGAGANFRMAWYLDGKPIFDTLARGNRIMPHAVTNYVFSVDVTAGEHVLAVMVASGVNGWSLICAGGAHNERYLAAPSSAEQGEWGLLSIVGDVVVGNCVTQREKICGHALFALDKEDGSLRWAKQDEGMFYSMGTAAGDGRLFTFCGASTADVAKARRRGRKIDAGNCLVAFDAATGDELWRQPDVPQVAQPRVQYAEGVVVLYANAAYDAESGAKLWQRAVSPERPPVIHGDWVIAQPMAYRLRTGEPRMVANILSGEIDPWRFGRAYGCGSVAGSRNLLFFRSGTYGFYDFLKQGTTTFGGVRPGCSLNMIAAGGLLVVPEGSSGCSCSYNFQTCVALVPNPSREDPWYVFRGDLPTERVRTMRLNFGAPGDRRDSRGNEWLAYPRPRAPWAQPVPADVRIDSARWYHHRRVAEDMQGTERAWVCGSGLEGEGKMVFDLVLPTQVTVATCAEAPTIDGRLDDVCWQGAEPTPFWRSAHLADPATTVFVRRDDEALYFAYRRAAAVRNGKSVPFVAKHGELDDAKCWEDDEVELFITDRRREKALQLGVSCAGGRFDGFNELPKKQLSDLKWDGEWTSEVKRTTEDWTAEIAVPLATLRQAGIDPASLAVNVLSQNLSGVGTRQTVLAPPGNVGIGWCRQFLALVDHPVEAPERAYTVRLHFAEVEGVAPGERVFDVKLQGDTVLEEFDIVKEADGPNRALVKEFPGIVAAAELALELVRVDGKAPAISGLELVALQD